MPDAVVCFIRLSNDYYRCDRLSSSRHRLLNIPDTRRTVQRWRSLGRILGRRLSVKQRGKNTLYYPFWHAEKISLPWAI